MVSLSWLVDVLPLSWVSWVRQCPAYWDDALPQKTRGESSSQVTRPDFLAAMYLGKGAAPGGEDGA